MTRAEPRRRGNEDSVISRPHGWPADAAWRRGNSTDAVFDADVLLVPLVEITLTTMVEQVITCARNHAP